jgi:hypothetical protein
MERREYRQASFPPQVGGVGSCRASEASADLVEHRIDSGRKSVCHIEPFSSTTVRSTASVGGPFGALLMLCLFYSERQGSDGQTTSGAFVLDVAQATWDYQQLKEFGPYAGKPGTGVGVH